MAKPNSKTTFTDYCLRSLGHPVIEINVDDDQIDDRVDEALQFYQEYHSDAVEKFYMKHKVTNSRLVFQAVTTGTFQVGEKVTGGTSGATAVVKSVPSTSTLRYNALGDSNVPFVGGETVTGGNTGATGVISSSGGIEKGDIENRYLPINDLIIDVIRLMPIRDSVTSSDMFDIRYQIHLNDIYSLGFMGTLSEYVMSQQFLSMLDLVIDSDEKHINFNRHKNQLEVFMDWDEEVDVDDYLVVECRRIVDPDTYTDVYNDYYLKKYATALIKKQWGTNLIKFEGMQMPGGVQFNGRQLFDDAKEELEKLEEEARLNWEKPVDFMTG
tara:strand:- start:4878 stop:5855 length:978 start_codon:yes stop_codon:yes gene_type:complete